MTKSLDVFLQEWNVRYQSAVARVPLFNPAVTSKWTADQRRYFTSVFYHVRGHTGETLWAMGNVAPYVQIKNIVVDLIREQFGGEGPSVDRLYLELSSHLGCDLRTEFLEEAHYLPFVRMYNEGQLRAIGELEWTELFIGFAAGQRVDAVDYPNLRGVFESFGLVRDQLSYFDAVARTDRFQGPMESALSILWMQNAEAIENGFESVRRFQLALWQELSDAVIGYQPSERAGESATLTASRERSRAGGDSEGGAWRGAPHYDPTKVPALPTKFADIAALDRGDPSCLRLVLDASTLGRMRNAYQRTTWGKNVLVIGANGFVGAHFLHRLLLLPGVQRAYALSRSRVGHAPADRIRATWEKYDLAADRIDPQKLIVLDGCLPQPRFGLPHEQYQELLEQVDTVFQCAGSTDYEPPYLELRSDWVFGLLGLLQFCLERNPKQVVYIGSTITHLYQRPEDFRRQDSWWYSGYSQMKWVNQALLSSLIEQGVRAQICEAPYVLGSTTVGKDPGFHYSFWRSIGLGAAMRVAWDGDFPSFAPVDYLVDAVVRNALAEQPVQVVRPVAPVRLRIADFAHLLGAKVVSWEDFLTAARRYATPDQMRLIPADTPELIAKTNLPPIYPPGFDLSSFPPVEQLAKLYLERLNLL